MTPLSIHIIGTGETQALFTEEQMAFDTHLRATSAVIIMDGTDKKNPTVTVFAKMPGGLMVGIETTYALFESVAKCVEGRKSYETTNGIKDWQK